MKVFIVIVVVAFALSVSGEKARRDVIIRQREQPMSDRSVYARRNFAHPDVVSDVYEVYVGPSTLPPVRKEAVVVLQGEKGNGVTGIISFSQASPDASVVLNGTITGLAPGTHGFHVHQKGDLTKGCTSMAGHFNPYNQTHGAPTDKHRHVGDLGNIQSNPFGVAIVAIADSQISLSGVNSIIGRGIVVHEKADDLGRGGTPDSLTTGNAGSRVACGVIGVV